MLLVFSKCSVPVYWEIHIDENCKTCFSIVERISKGGRPLKTKRGRKSGNEKLEQTTAENLPNLEGLKTKTLKISRSMDTYRTADFEANFHFKETVKADLCCPICKDILDMPLETSCKYYFCTTCFSGAL